MTIVEQDVRVSAPPRVREDAREERARILEAAALEIEVRGHGRGWGENDDGNVCLVGALALAQGRPARDREFSEVENPWRGDAPHGTDDLWQFNDASDAGEVTFLLRWRAEEIRDGR